MHMVFRRMTVVGSLALAVSPVSGAAHGVELVRSRCVPVLATPHKVQLAQDQTDASEVINVRFGGRDFAIPRSYFDRDFLPDLRYEPDSLFIRVYLPALTPTPTRPPSDSGHGETVEISLEKRLAPLNALFAAAAADRIKTEPFRSAYGLRSFRAEVVHQTTPPHSREIYFAQRDQVVTVFIECEPGYPSPPCHHEFDADGLRYRLIYKMQYLPDWERIQRGVVDVVRGFEHRAK